MRCPEEIEVRVEENTIEILCQNSIEGAYVEVGFQMEEALRVNSYILFPACCYKGNQFKSIQRAYPPLLTPEEASIDMEPVITDVPRLNMDGSGKIEVTTGDVSVPCIGIFNEKEKKAVYLYTIQQINGYNLGLCYENGCMWVQYPSHREKIYRPCRMVQSEETGITFEKGERISIPYRIYEFTCNTIKDFYHFFFEHRKCMGLDSKRAKGQFWNEQFEIQKDKFNRLNWADVGKFYGSGVVGSGSFCWEPGWCGGAMATYALMKLGGELEWNRSVMTLHHLFRTQAPSGFFYEMADESGKVMGMDSGLNLPGAEQWHLIRKSGDVLYFLFRHFALFRERKIEIPEIFLTGTKKLADAFVKLWNTYGQFGQFVDLQSGEIIVGGSTSGAIVPAALVEAYRWFDDSVYLDIAKKAAELYYTRDALKGYTTGAPGEILQCPDSESCFALLESMVVLYDVTKDPEWLERAEYMAELSSSWVVSYNYVFPPQSEFYRLGIKTVGSVFANVQNKHSAPGICTLSGDSLYKLYQWTGKKAYLELCKDIVLTISQYMSTEKRPVMDWNVPQGILPAGYICERVNMSDWETARCVGGVFNGSCWSETSNLLVIADIVTLEGFEEIFAED